MQEDDVIVQIDFPLESLRLVHACVARCYETWPGGDPQDQIDLEDLKRELWTILMSTLYETEQI